MPFQKMTNTVIFLRRLLVRKTYGKQFKAFQPTTTAVVFPVRSVLSSHLHDGFSNHSALESPRLYSTPHNKLRMILNQYPRPPNAAWLALHSTCQIKKIKSLKKAKRAREIKRERGRERKRAGLKGRLHGDEHKNTVS